MPNDFRKPPAPCVEDFDDARDDVVSGSKREARKQSPPTKSLIHPHTSRRDAASDSGYSSHTSNTAASGGRPQSVATNPPTAPSSHSAGQTTAKPSLQRTESQRTQPRSSRTPSVSRPPPDCADPHCLDSNCLSSRNVGRAYVLPHRPQAQQPPQRSHTAQYPVQDSKVANPYNQTPHYAYAQVPPSQQPSYPTQPVPRPRTSSRARPDSWAPGSHPGVNMHQHAGIPYQPAYNAQQYGPPPSPSAYRNSYLAQYPSEWQAMAPQLTSGSPRDPYGSYMPGYGAHMPPNSQAYQAAIQPNYSARTPTASGQETPGSAVTIQQPSQPTISARRSSIMPGSFPGEPLTFGLPSDSSSESSESEDYDDRHHQSRQHRKREQTRRDLEDRRAMPPPLTRERRRDSRPPLPHTQTTPADVRRRSREAPRRAPYSDPHMSHEYLELDRTSRPNIEKRPTYHSNRESRPPVISHHPPPARSSSRSFSHSSRVVQQYVVEDADGRKRIYDSLEQAEAKASRLTEERRLQAAEAYQSDKRGDRHISNLTAESIKRTQTQQPERKPSSRVSGSSRKSGTSSRHSISESMIQIKQGNTTIMIPANAGLDIRQTENGIAIGSGSPPRDKSYHGGSSKSSGSRRGRGSDVGSRRRDTFTEDGYEPGY